MVEKSLQSLQPNYNNPFQARQFLRIEDARLRHTRATLLPLAIEDTAGDPLIILITSLLTNEHTCTMRIRSMVRQRPVQTKSHNPSIELLTGFVSDHTIMYTFLLVLLGRRRSSPQKNASSPYHRFQVDPATFYAPTLSIIFKEVSRNWTA